MACIEELHHKDCIGLHSTNPLRTQCHREKRKREIKQGEKKTETFLNITADQAFRGGFLFFSFFFSFFLHQFGRQDVLKTKFRTNLDMRL